MAATKTCKRCFRERPLRAFHRDASLASGRRNECSECRSLPARSTLERFLSRVVRTEACWLWIGARTGAGYGEIQAGHRSPAGYLAPTLAHRFAYEYFIGPIPAELQIDHLCRVRHCVNPAHLEPVTNWENGRRGRLARAAA